MPKGVNRIIVRHRQVAEHSAPEPDINYIRLGRDGDLNLLNRPTIRHASSCADNCGNFPREFDGNAFVCEPVANFIRRSILREKDGVITGENAYPHDEFIISTYERFRPVNLFSGPDGDMVSRHQ